VAFTVEDFQDLLRLLEARPEWRAELRRLLIPDELLELPAVVRQLAEDIRHLTAAQRRTESLVAQLVEAQSRAEQRLGRVEERVGRLEEGQARLETAMAQLAVAQTRTDARLGRLEAGQARLESALARLTDAQEHTGGRLRRVEGRLAGLRGDNLEQRYREHAGGYFGRLLRRARIVSPDELDDILDEGLATGAFDEDSAHDVRLADLVVRGRRHGEELETYLVVEVSGVVESADVERAARRAALLGRVRPTVAVVGGEEITRAASKLAQAHTSRSTPKSFGASWGSSTTICTATPSASPAAILSG